MHEEPVAEAEILERDKKQTQVFKQNGMTVKRRINSLKDRQSELFSEIKLTRNADLACRSLLMSEKRHWKH